jgi:transcriptional regulator with XRE-family HTH domain
LKDAESTIGLDRCTFGEWIRTARRAAGLSQAALAKAARISSVYVSQIEAGLRIPSDRNTRLIAQAVGLPWQEVLRVVYSLRSREAGELFGDEISHAESGWRSISSIPAVRQLLLELAGLNLSRKDIETLARNWSNDVRFITALTKAQIR